jgi:hypothetical protein
MMGDLQCQARLFDLARVGQGQQATKGTLELANDHVKLILSTDDWR